MAEIEIGALADRMGDDEIKELSSKLDKLGAPKLQVEADGDRLSVARVDGDVLIEFLDRLDAYDLACDIYLPTEFEGRVEVGDYTVGSAAALLEVLEEMKDELAPDDDDDLDDQDENGEDDEDEDDVDDYEDMKIIEGKLRVLWKVIYDGAQTAVDKNLPLHVLSD